MNGFVDSDPERTRRDQMGKTKDSLSQLEQALEVSEKDVKDATQGVMRDLKRFQKEKEDDLTRYMVSLYCCYYKYSLISSRLPMHDVISSGQGKTWNIGMKPKRKSTRSRPGKDLRRFLLRT